MNADSTLSLRCPSCGNRTQKSLAAIKAQTAFSCECGYHANLKPCNSLKPRDIAATQTPRVEETEEALAITA